MPILLKELEDCPGMREELNAQEAEAGEVVLLMLGHVHAIPLPPSGLAACNACTAYALSNSRSPASVRAYVGGNGDITATSRDQQTA